MGIFPIRLPILQDQGTVIFIEKVGEAVGAVVFVIILIMAIVWVVKKLKIRGISETRKSKDLISLKT